MGATSWLIGSHPSIGAVTITIRHTSSGANETLNVVTSESPFYLYDGGSSFDAMAALQDAVRGYADQDIESTDVFLTRDRKVRIEWEDVVGFDPQPVRIEAWGGAGASAFQALLGFDGSEISASYTTSVTADETSPYLWSPNARETSTEARRGELGNPYHDTAVGMSGTRVVVATTNNSGYTNNFIWRNVINERYWSSDPQWGEYYLFWDFVQRQFRKFKLYSDVNELDASTSAATLGTGLGPYIYRWGGDSPLSFPFHRELDYLETLHAVEIPMVVVDEYE